jgi:DMSO reductase family type II enzyme heme b subunit
MMAAATMERLVSALSAVAAGLVLAGTLAGAAAAAPGDAEKGEKVYQHRCLGCHGDEGDGLGPAAERLNPPPRDFTLGLYKIKTSAFDADVPNDDDIYRMIKDGMPGTAMPGWSDVLSEQDMWDLVAYLKAFAEIEEAPEGQIDYGSQIESSADSIARGREIFLDGERCSECHGTEGRGDGIKKLKDDNGARTWPRNLTKAWTFRADNSAKEIFRRISAGIPGTQMPSFADPKSKKKLSIEERWHVANFVASLAKTTEVVNPAKTVIIAAKLDGALPTNVDDPKWAEAQPVTFMLVPQIIAEDRFFTPAHDSITARAFYDDKAVAMLLEWDDRTKSIPGDDKAKQIADEVLSPDMVAVQLPVTIPVSQEKPYFLMGDKAHPVNIWRWTSGSKETGEKISLMDATGPYEFAERDAAKSGLTASGAYKDGTWRVLMTRPLATGDASGDLQFIEGRYIPVAFANWDGSNSESESSHTVTSWYWLLLEPATGSRPLIAALIVVLLLAAAEIWWARSARKTGA